MSPELEKLLEALYEKRTCPLEEKPHRDATFERLLQDTLARRPRTGRDELLEALHDRYSFRSLRLPQMTASEMLVHLP